MPKGKRKLAKVRAGKSVDKDQKGRPEPSP